ncbi:MAG: hypothetical protein DI537_05530 [Stutzerimonas stutzeri]|nr:MAG: hypothetical protein DI537_05530 [Stutzerimonas stutzeri]
MSKPVLIGEVDVGGAAMPVFATQLLVDRLLRVTLGYTGDDESQGNVARLLEDAASSLRSGGTQFSHMVRDRTWRGDPDKIESDRVSVSISVGVRSLTLGFPVRKIAKRDPRFQKIAHDALATLEKYQARRDV